jgi:hypothetical protein
METTNCKFEASADGFDPAEAELLAWEELEGVSADAAQGEEEATVFRYLRARQRLASEAQRIADQMKAMIADNERRVKALDYVYANAAERYAAEKTKGKKTKSVKTPFGTIGFRTKGALLVVEDEGDLRADPAYADCFEPVPPKLVKAKLDEAFRTTGALPSGCTVRPGGESFYLPK